MVIATHLPPPPPLVWIQSPACIPPGGVRCLASNSTHNAFVLRILENKVANSIKGKPRSLMQPTYPLPDNQLWTLAATPPWMRYKVFKMLHGKQLALRQWTGPSVITTGKRGRPTVALYHHPSDCTQASGSITDKLFTFAAAVWEGKYGLRATVKVQSVKRALWHVTQKLILDGHPNPRKASPAQQQLDFPMSWLLKSFQDSDPAAEPKLALPMLTISAISQNY
jgi:hypothetical protein